MDLYISSMLLGVLGLTAMALSGLGHHGHAGHAQGQAGDAHGGDLHGHHGHAHSPGDNGGSSSVLWMLMSPRFLFSFALGAGAAGELVRPWFGGPLQLAIALVGGVLFERLLVGPLWNMIMRFASAPALTLESAVTDEATAVTAFDSNGQGIVSLELDGQVVQVLATLTAGDRATGMRVRAGQRVRIEDVNPTNNCCTVSLL